MPLKPATRPRRASKKLGEIKNEFERGVFLAVYDSARQKRRRRLAATLLCLKHVLRGLLFSWPLYMLAWAATRLPGQASLVFLPLLLPAIWVSWTILSRGVREDYRNLVEGSILHPGFLGRMLFHKEV